ncbi:MAG: hypothetical protein QM808_11025 [Steroidobacteraceae bacterium]
MNNRNSLAVNLAINLAAGALSALLGTSVQAADNAEQWQRIDFDADLTSYLVNLKQVSRKGDIGTIWELNVPGRTSISTGGQNHTLIERLFDCKAGTQRIGQVLVYANLGAKAKSLPHEDISYKLQPNSIDEIEAKLACDGTAPEANVYTSLQYSSTKEAVTKAFGDAIKLPREQSNKTLKGLGPMGPPAAGNAPPAGAPNAGPARPQ